MRRSCGGTRRAACSAIRTSSAATPAGRRNFSASPMPMWDRSKCPTNFRTSKCCSSPTSSSPATWPPTFATSSKAIRSPSGAAGQSDSLRSAALLLGAERVIAIDTVLERLALAKEAGAETIDFQNADVYDHIQGMTKGRGADACIDAVGTELETNASADSLLDRVKVATFPSAPIVSMSCARRFAAAEISAPCRSYGGFVDKIPMGSAINRGFDLRMGQTPVQSYTPKLLKMIENGAIDPSFVITHTATLDEGPELYKKP
jgi:hypothetical protein